MSEKQSKETYFEYVRRIYNWLKSNGNPHSLNSLRPTTVSNTNDRDELNTGAL